jgi:hypothetical protein
MRHSPLMVASVAAGFCLGVLAHAAWQEAGVKAASLPIPIVYVNLGEGPYGGRPSSAGPFPDVNFLLFGFDDKTNKPTGTVALKQRGRTEPFPTFDTARVRSMILNCPDPDAVKKPAPPVFLGAWNSNANGFADRIEIGRVGSTYVVTMAGVQMSNVLIDDAAGTLEFTRPLKGYPAQIFRGRLNGGRIEGSFGWAPDMRNPAGWTCTRAK